MCEAARALENDVLVPGKAVGFERLEDQARCARLFARRIDVLDTNKPAPLMGPGLQIAGNGRDQ